MSACLVREYFFYFWPTDLENYDTRTLFDNFEAKDPSEPPT